MFKIQAVEQINDNTKSDNNVSIAIYSFKISNEKLLNLNNNLGKKVISTKKQISLKQFKITFTSMSKFDNNRSSSFGNYVIKNGHR